MQHNKSKFGLGLILGAAAGIAGGYVLSKKKNEIRARLWMLRAKFEIRRRAAMAGELTEEAFGDIVDSVLREYRGMKGITANQLRDFAARMKERWEDFKAGAADIESDSEVEYDL